jgi:signal transduction histidine kinase
LIGDLVGKVCYQAGEGRDAVCDDCPVELSFQDGLVHRAERTRNTGTATFSLDITSSPLRDAAGNIVAVVELVRDNTEKKRAEEALRRSHEKLEMTVKERTAELSAMNEQLRNLSRYLQKAREEERTRIAREVHDDLGQSLTALKIDLALLGKRLLTDRQQAMELLSSMGLLVDATIQSVKRISMDLRPGVLDHLGLCAAIEWQAKDFQERTGISCDVILEAEDGGLDRDRATTVFRVLQETLTNITRHARATKATVRLRKGPEGLMLRVSDNGIGITEKQLSDPKSLGLIGMRERVYSWGGSLTIGEGRNRGTVVTVEIPVNGREKRT